MTSWIEKTVNEFLEDAEYIYGLLESETHHSQYTLTGKKFTVVIARKDYLEGTGHERKTKDSKKT